MLKSIAAQELLSYSSVSIATAAQYTQHKHERDHRLFGGAPVKVKTFDTCYEANHFESFNFLDLQIISTISSQ